MSVLQVYWVPPAPSPEGGNRSSFRNVVFCFLEYRTLDKVQKPNSPECHIPSSEPFKVYMSVLV
jgi:hypothetical protein